jgi:3',5'-cyclic AMP phosphodiesterase CpdA
LEVRVAVLRLLHASDFHIAVNPGQRYQNGLQPSHHPVASQDFARSVYEMSSGRCFSATTRNTTFDALIISGDLAATGKSADLKAAYEFLTATPDSVAMYVTPSPAEKATLQGVAQPFFVVPGNHDRFTSDFNTPFGGKEFDTWFSQKRPGHQQGCWNAVGPHADSMFRGVSTGVLESDSHRLKIVIIGVDFCLENMNDVDFFVPLGAFGQGVVRGQRCQTLDLLRRRTEEAQAWAKADLNFDTIIVWVMHFPPVPDTDPRLKLNDFRFVTELAGDLGVDLILGGHLHVSSETKFGQKSHGRVWCVGSAMAIGRFWGNDDFVKHMLTFKHFTGNAAVEVECELWKYLNVAGGGKAYQHANSSENKSWKHKVRLVR